jgi:hypothetical protein
VSQLFAEDQILLSKAAGLFPGQRPNSTTLTRWSRRGVYGIRLETLRIGGRRYTSKQAIARFLEALNRPEDEQLSGREGDQ